MDQPGSAVKTFHDPAHMAHDMNGAIDAIIIASNTKNHAKDAHIAVEAQKTANIPTLQLFQNPVGSILVLFLLEKSSNYSVRVR